MPTSCQDLQLLGHTLNGLHLIKATHPGGGSKIEVVFCEFNLLPNLNGLVKCSTGYSLKYSLII